MFQERWYQTECTEALFKDVISSPDCHPIGVAPTGSGKTAILTKLIEKIFDHNPLAKILVLAADKRILDQNHKAIEQTFQIEVGLCSAGLGSYEIRMVTVAGIQSIYRKSADFKEFDFVIIDECHLINTKEKGMYRNFLSKLKANYIGLTATHFRTGHGYIHEGKDALFNKISYDMSEPEKYNRIVDEGYLSPLYSYPTALKVTGDGCRTTAGDWNEKDLAKKNDREEITTAAILETIHYGKKYNHWLFFAIDTTHCDNIARILNDSGIAAVSIHSKHKNVDERIEDFKRGKYRAAVQVNMLTTGFDFPLIDLIADLRPTKSPIVHVQGKGRGARVVYADGFDLSTIDGRLAAIEAGPKQHCLVLDFAGNTERLGPINYIKIKTKEKEKGKGQAITKNCPECKFINWGGAKVCVNCGHEFEFIEKLKMKASAVEIVKQAEQEKPKKNLPRKQWLRVDKVEYRKHVSRAKKNSPPILKVTYHCGFRTFVDWVALDHGGFPRHNAKHWITTRWNSEGAPPDSVDSAFEFREQLLIPSEIEVDNTKKMFNVIDARF